MFKNRNAKMLGATVLIIAAILVTLSAVNVPSPAAESSKQDVSELNEQALVPVTSNEEGEASPVLELAAKTTYTAEIRDEIRAENQADSTENSSTAPEETNAMPEQYEFKILQWENAQNSR